MNASPTDLSPLWLKSYPPGVSWDIDYAGCRTLPDIMNDAVARFGDRPAYICMGRTMTYGDIDAASRKLAGFFARRGLKAGDRVAIMMPNVLQYPVAVAALVRAGLIIVNVNPLYTPRELEHQLKDSGARAIIVLEQFAPTLEAVLARTKIETIVIGRVGDLLGPIKGAVVNFVVRRKTPTSYNLPGAVAFNAALAEGAGTPAPTPELKGEDVAVLQYTGGTTGLAKGATLTHHALVSAVMSSEQWLRPLLERKKLTEGAIYICALPLYHVYAFVNCSLMAMRAGGAAVLIPNPRDIPGLVKEISKYRFNLFPGVNTLFNALAHDAGFARLDFSAFVGSTGGGAAVQKAVADQWRAITGAPIIEGYGLSETCSGIVCNRTDISAFTGTVGLPMPGVEIGVIDDDENRLAPGAAGEIVVRGPQVMAGYWNQPEETRKAMTADGWFKTGDIGTIDDDGQLRIVDRKKDMILVSGFNVYPNEIEDVAAAHPGVLEAAAVGAPDARTGEAVYLYVVRKDPELTAEDLRKYLRGQLTAYKTPHFIEFRDVLPKTNVGKILRRELRDETLARS